MPDRVKLSQVAYQRFKERLFANDMRPGQFVSQRELAALTGVPLGPMREALQKLESVGLVRIIPQRGIRVADANLKMIRDTFHLRLMIEKEAVARFVDGAPDAAIDELETAHREILAQARAGRPDDALIAHAQSVDWHLHDTIVEHTGNEILFDIHTVNSDRIRLIRLDRGLLRPTFLATSIEEHLAVIEACKRRDEAAAVHAIELHIAMAMRRAMGL